MALLKDKTQPNADGFCPMVIGGHTYTEKKAAGTAILGACNALTSADPIPLGSYRGFKLTLCLDSFEKLFKISMQGTLTYKVGLGTDVFGNIQRMDNLLENMPTRQLDYKELSMMLFTKKIMRYVTLSDSELRLAKAALIQFRNKLIAKGLPTEDVNTLLLKLYK